MPQAPSMLFLPGFGARVGAYVDGLPVGWEPLQPPLRSTNGSLVELREWLLGEMERRGRPVVLAGHSLGGALAILAAAAAPDRVRGLVLIGPAGLPLTKPVRASLADFGRQLAAGTHRLTDVAASLREVASAPRGAARLVRTLRALDLSDEMRRVRRACVPVRVVGCFADTLVPVASTERIAHLLGGSHLGLDAPEGHVWPVARHDLLFWQLARPVGSQ